MHAHEHTRPPAPLRLLLTALLLASGLTAAGAASPAAAAARADLTVAAVTAPATATAGQQAALGAVVKNAGRRDAGATTTRFVLSRDRSAGRSDTTLGSVRTRAVDRAARRTVRLTATIPASASGRWYVVACADSKRSVRESREANNCRASDALTVTAPPTGTGFPMVPEPVTVGEAVLEADRATTMTAYPFAETTITTTAADGTVYTLVVPEGALLSALPITMTPVSAVGDLPLTGGLRAAVQLEPHGLLLQKPAVLTIDSPELGPLQDQTAFLFHGDGDDFHAYPPDMPRAGDDADVLRLSLTHFSTPGVGSGEAPGVPVRSLGQLEAVVSELLRAERASQLAGNDPDPTTFQKVHALMRSYYDNVVKDQLQQAESDPEKAAQATSEALAWMRQMQLTGVEEDPRFDDAWSRIERIWRNAMNHFWTKCRTENDLGSAAVLMGIARQAQLFSWSWAEEATDKAQRCANFEVRFASDVTRDYRIDGDTQDHTESGAWSLRATAELPWTGIGEGALAYDAYRYRYRIDYPSHEDCGPIYTELTGTGTDNGRLTAMMSVDVNPREIPPGEQTAPPPVTTLRIVPGFSLQGGSKEPTETVHTDSVSCSPSTSDSKQSMWLDTYASLHLPDPRWDIGALVLPVLPAEQSGQILMSEQWTTSRGNGSNQAREVDVTLVELVHKPLN